MLGIDHTINTVYGSTRPQEKTLEGKKTGQDEVLVIPFPPHVKTQKIDASPVKTQKITGEMKEHVILQRKNVHKHVVFVSDVHGHLDSLNALLDHLDKEYPQLYTVIFVGDLLHGGAEPDDSVNVVKRVRELQDKKTGEVERALSVKGNHEVESLECYQQTEESERPERGAANTITLLGSAVVASVAFLLF